MKVPFPGVAKRRQPPPARPQGSTIQEQLNPSNTSAEYGDVPSRPKVAADTDEDVDSLLSPASEKFTVWEAAPKGQDR